MMGQSGPDAMTGSGASALMNPVETRSFIQASRADKKLYVANIPKGINAPTVFLSLT